MNTSKFTAAAILGLAGSCIAQELAWVATGNTARQIGGFRTAGIGDINGDGFEDLATIVDPSGTGPTDGYLWFLSGRDGTLLREFASACIWCGFISLAGAGDMDGDGVPDYVASQITGNPGFPYYFTDVRSGVDDSLLWQIVGSWDQVLSDLDLDGDGLNDLVVCNWTMQGYLGEMRAFSHGGSRLYTLVGDLSPSNPLPLAIGSGMAKLGDVDDDGCDDYAMACLEPTGRGCTVVVSGRTGTYIRACYGAQPGDGIGIIITETGDLDGDGYCDFATGNGGGSFMNRGIVRAFSSRTGVALYQWERQPADDFSKSLAGRDTDLDGDGVPDVVIGQPAAITGPGITGAVHAFSGRDGSQLHYLDTVPQTSPGYPGSLIGYHATVLRPPVGQTTGFLIVPNPYGSGGPNMMGRIAAYRGIPRTAEVLGTPCAGNLPTAPRLGMKSLGASGVRVHLTQAPANSPALLLIGLSTTQFYGVPLPAPLDHLGLPGCMLRTAVGVMATATTGTTGFDTGYASLDLPLPIPATGNGTWSVSAQWLVLGDASTYPGGMTEAIRWRR